MSVIELHCRRVNSILLASFFFFSSCYSYRVATHAQGSTENIATNRMKAYSMFWGLIQKPQVIHTPICDSLGVNGVAEVKVKANVGCALLTVFTLGIYCP